MPSPSGRGNRDGAYLIPVPHDTRRHGAKGPIFSNHLSILFYRIEPRHAGRISDIVGELSRQMMDQIRDRFPECCMAALEMFKPSAAGILCASSGETDPRENCLPELFGFGRNLPRHDGIVRRPDFGCHAPDPLLAVARLDHVIFKVRQPADRRTVVGG